MEKICVYAIAKNEIKFIDRWYESVKEADYVCVLDTGSTDGSFEKFKNLGIIVQQKIYENFRFDVARNDSQKLIPEDADICVCVDIDEFFEKGWAEKLKREWKDDVARAKYRYTWNFASDGREGVVFYADKIHKRGAFVWSHPVHEVLTPIDDKPYKTITTDLKLFHKADNEKSRANYLPLLEQSVKEDPTDDRNMHYLGREHMFHGEYEKSIETLKKHLNLPTATWRDERCASLRYIATCYMRLNKRKKQEEYLLKAILEANYLREPYFELGVMYYEDKEFLKSAVIFEEMLKIVQRNLNYISSPICWGSAPYDYLSLDYFEIGEYQKSLSCLEFALQNSPNNDRLKKNYEIIKEYAEKSKLKSDNLK